MSITYWINIQIISIFVLYHIYDKVILLLNLFYIDFIVLLGPWHKEFRHIHRTRWDIMVVDIYGCFLTFGKIFCLSVLVAKPPARNSTLYFMYLFSGTCSQRLIWLCDLQVGSYQSEPSRGSVTMVQYLPSVAREVEVEAVHRLRLCTKSPKNYT